MRKGLKKLICAGLVLAMILSLAACGKDDETGTVGGKVDGKKNPNAALAKEYVYSEQPLDIPEMGDDIGIRDMIRVEDSVYVIYEVYHWDSETQQNEMKLLSMNVDGSNVQVKDIQLYMGGVKPNAGVAESETAEGESGEAAAEKPVGDMSVMENYTYEYTGINRLIIGDDNKMYGIKNYNYYEENYSNPEKSININDNYVCCWDMEGTMLWESKMEPLQTEESWAYVQNIVPMADNGIGVLISGDKLELMAVSADGTLSERKPLPGNADALNYTSDMFVQEDGTVNYIYWDYETGDKLWMNSYDFATGTAGEPQQLPDSLYMSGYMGLADGGDVADIVYTTNLGVFALNMGDTEPRQLMSFINSDIATNSMNNIMVLDDTHILGFYYDNISDTNKGSLFTKVNPEDVKDKAVLVLAANYVAWDLKNRIVDFNKTNSEYRIVVKDYSTYNTMDDYMASYTQLNNDILASGMPDILVADTNMPIDSYIAKGLLADVDKLIAEDAELSQKEFMQNVFDAYRVDGKLYSVIPSFYVRTYIGKASVVGDRTGWTMADMKNLMATLPEGTMIMSEMVRDSFMYTMMQYCGSDFIDLTTGKCAFDSENFIAMLEFANTLPAEWSEDIYGEDYWMNYESQYREDRTVLMNCFVSDAREMNRNINGYFGEKISYIGFPTDSGKGSVLLANNQYVLSAKSENLEGAWEFIRYYLSDEYQKELNYELSVNKAIFKENANKAMEKPYYINEETGEKVEYEDTFYINGQEITLPTMTQEQVNEFVSFVESVDKRAYYNDEVQNIINEEAAAFFEGQKSAADVAGIIQSRVQIYVNENM